MAGDAQQRGYEVVWLQKAFSEEYKKHGRRLDLSPGDGHWNEIARQLAAEKLMKFLSALGAAYTLLERNAVYDP